MNWKSILRLRFIGVILALALVVAIPVGYVAATEDHFDGGHHYHFGHFIIDPIKTDAGYVAGTMIGDIGSEVRIYRGIPYAAPPVGDLRWKPPQAVTPWKGIRECTKFSLYSPQAFPALPVYGGMKESDMGEDCLYLNVLTPAKKENERLPVMVWFHGGGLSRGGGNSSLYNLPYLSQHGVVLVSVTHRLGPFGYMAHPLLTAESPNNASGNYGQLDLIAALEWVKKNIAAFGGDPRCVTIFGESGGGAKVLWLMSSPLSKGLFHRAIVESGGAGGAAPLNQVEQYGVNLANKLVVSDLAGLRAKTWQEIITAALTPGSGYADVQTVDGWSLLDTPLHIFQAGSQKDVPFMIGINEKDIPSVFTGTQDLVSTMKPLKSKNHVYLFTFVTTDWRMEIKAPHAMELAYVFHGYGLLPLLVGNYVQGVTNPNPKTDWMDDWVSEAMMTMWAQFAETGNPSVKGFVMWPAYQYATDQYLKIDYPLQVESGFSTLVR
jgi:para-nitrobenzyl esterase